VRNVAQEQEVLRKWGNSTSYPLAACVLGEVYSWIVAHDDKGGRPKAVFLPDYECLGRRIRCGVIRGRPVRVGGERTLAPQGECVMIDKASYPTVLSSPQSVIDTGARHSVIKQRFTREMKREVA
jgi:hypothetical protein